jgi:hypothetical protein
MTMTRTLHDALSRLALLAALLAGGPVGCTYMAWHGADDPFARYPDVPGVLPPDAGSAEAGLVLLRYQTAGVLASPPRAVYGTVPVGADGLPAGPFRYDGPTTRPADAVTALPEDRRRALLAATVVWVTDARADAVRADPRFRPAESEAVEVGYDLTDPDHRMVRAWWAGTKRRSTGRDPCEKEPRAGPNPTVATASESGPEAGAAFTLLLPYKVAAPPEVRRAARRSAAVQTPLAVAGDAVLVPAMVAGSIAWLPVELLLRLGFAVGR